MIDVIIIGGGAAGFFASLAAKAEHPHSSVVLLEKSAVLLSKVRVSGGGRCNTTHACFEPKALVQNYPRGSSELIGPFHRFGPREILAWFEARGVRLKTEADGRMFPTTDSSETIIECFMNEAKKIGVDIRLRQRIEKISKENDRFTIYFKEAPPICCRKLILATGSSTDGHTLAKNLGHSINPPVPSLFTFNIPTSRFKALSGISIDPVRLQIKDTSFSQTGPLLITHFGFSGPAVLKLSAWAARELHEKNYKTTLIVNWLPNLTQEQIFQTLFDLKKKSPQRNLLSENPFKLPKNFWKMMSSDKRLNDLSLKDLSHLSSTLHADLYEIEGKTTNKEEFVTCGGVSCREVNFKTMESKICSHLFFAGEILDIDGVTGGFNFQNAWTTGFIAGSS